MLAADMQITRRRAKTAVAHEHLDDHHGHSVFHQVRGKAMAQTMNASPVGQPGPSERIIENLLSRAIAKRLERVPAAGKNPVPRVITFPISAQLFKETVA
jgi:hypothetical protein